MKMHWDMLQAGSDAPHLWVLLPGAYMAPPDFLQAGFIDAVRSRRLPHDIAMLEANVAQVADGSALAFLQEFLAGERAAAARTVALCGISLGAWLALACLARGAREPATTPGCQAASRVGSALLLAPYLGPRDLVAEVEAAGPAGWTAAPEGGEGDPDRAIWQWLGHYPQRPHDAPCTLYLARGQDDRFARAHALLARLLPAGHDDVQPGGHVWPVWTRLWNRHLDQAYVS